MASARNGRLRTGEESELAVADGDRAELQLGRSSVRHAPSRPQWAESLADARNTVAGTLWQGPVGNRSRSIMSTHEHQGRYIRNSLRPHEGTFRALALWTKRRAALKTSVTSPVISACAGAAPIRSFKLLSGRNQRTVPRAPARFDIGDRSEGRGHCSKDH